MAKRKPKFDLYEFDLFEPGSEFEWPFIEEGRIGDAIDDILLATGLESLLRSIRDEEYETDDGRPLQPHRIRMCWLYARGAAYAYPAPHPSVAAQMYEEEVIDDADCVIEQFETTSGTAPFHRWWTDPIRGIEIMHGAIGREASQVVKSPFRVVISHLQLVIQYGAPPRKDPLVISKRFRMRHHYYLALVGENTGKTYMRFRWRPNLAYLIELCVRDYNVGKIDRAGLDECLEEYL